jgi:hypothetical protein
MTKKEMLDKLSIYIPQKKMEEKPVERLIRLGNKKDRSINYLVVEAILEWHPQQDIPQVLQVSNRNRGPLILLS